jgi:hypothetical protein
MRLAFFTAMKVVAGVFDCFDRAVAGIKAMQTTGIPDRYLNLLTPGEERRIADDVPTTEAEAPGMGAALGALVGGVSGGALGPVLLGLAVAGLGPVSAVGLYAAALMGAGGAVAGGLAGGALEKALSEGLPRDELFVYEDALRQGKTVVIAVTATEEQTSNARRELSAAGAESIDAARQQWWVGLRDAEEAYYRAEGLDFDNDEEPYRAGFEAAQDPDFRRRSFDDAVDALRRKYPDVHTQKSFREGYIRGQAYREQICR